MLKARWSGPFETDVVSEGPCALGIALTLDDHGFAIEAAAFGIGHQRIIIEPEGDVGVRVHGGIDMKMYVFGIACAGIGARADGGEGVAAQVIGDGDCAEVVDGGVG